MKYIMSLDGGGTKVQCVVADEHGHVFGCGIAGPTNSVFNTAEEVTRSISEAIDQALAGGRVPVPDIAVVYYAMPADSNVSCRAICSRLYDSVAIRFVSEFTMSLYAAIQQEIGGLALAGTGSFAIAGTGHKMHRVGGYGSLLGDEGSGYHIGRRALNACVHMLDGIGAPTSMYEEILDAFQRLGYSSLFDIYALPTGAQRSFVASICKVVGRSANRGDAVASAILLEAAEQLAAQMNGVLDKCGDERQPGFPVSIAGGVWKAHPVLYRVFADNVKRMHPEVNIVPPLFSPVAGGILLGLKERGYSIESNLSHLKQCLADFICRLPE
jgi:N-acetylglucosamine kinase-like BadF-type ATPase